MALLFFIYSRTTIYNLSYSENGFLCFLFSPPRISSISLFFFFRLIFLMHLQLFCLKNFHKFGASKFTSSQTLSLNFFHFFLTFTVFFLPILLFSIFFDVLLFTSVATILFCMELTKQLLDVVCFSCQQI